MDLGELRKYIAQNRGEMHIINWMEIKCFISADKKEKGLGKVKEPGPRLGIPCFTYPLIKRKRVKETEDM